MRPGTIIAGKYKLTHCLGQGAMGVVWAAINEFTEKPVALKLIPKWGQESEEVRRRLLREARAYGRLNHRNVVEIYDVGQTDEGEPFLVMQLLTGETLGQLMKREKKLKPQFACLIAQDISRALGAAHAAGIVHRDLKPPNVYLHRERDAETDIPLVKVLDFGVSKMLSGQQDGSKTETGSAVGSPAYMSPEQAKGERFVDHRTDIWSVGVLLFEMLTGKRPFEGETMFTVVADILKGRIPRVAEVAPEIEPMLSHVVARCIERDLAKRVQTADELVSLLRPFAGVRQTSLDMSAMLASVTGPLPRPPNARIPTYVPPAAPPPPAPAAAPPSYSPAPAPAAAPAPPEPPVSSPPKFRSTIRMEDPGRGVRPVQPSMSDIPTAPGVPPVPERPIGAAGTVVQRQAPGPAAPAMPRPPASSPVMAGVSAVSADVVVVDEETHQREPAAVAPAMFGTAVAASGATASDSRPGARAPSSPSVESGAVARAVMPVAADVPFVPAADDDSLLDAATSVMISRPAVLRPMLPPPAPEPAAPAPRDLFGLPVPAPPAAAPEVPAALAAPISGAGLFDAPPQPALSSVSGLQSLPGLHTESNPPSPLSTNSPITASFPGASAPALPLADPELILQRARQKTRGRVILFSAVGGAILMVLLLFGLRNSSNEGNVVQPVAFEGIAPRHNAIAAVLRQAAAKAAAGEPAPPSSSEPASSATAAPQPAAPPVNTNRQPPGPIKKTPLIPGGKKKFPRGVPDSPG